MVELKVQTDARPGPVGNEKENPVGEGVHKDGEAQTEAQQEDQILNQDRSLDFIPLEIWKGYQRFIRQEIEMWKMWRMQLQRVLMEVEDEKK
ncbi:hypothetical protein CAEBREN_11249 [Caenorhabditis brenneri]|uniref:Uncharacterized protein n=1 Tax=Caenorhabditis brenneri TaxID=135651 RepID=G0NS55_CAEBE|nr:hypothetical protein CAEBREN_11249 [Caenorhabditis brenneri]